MSFVQAKADADRAGAPRRSSLLRHPGILIGISLVIAALIAGSWLVLPYMVEGRGLLTHVGARVQEQRRANAIGIGQFLTRYTEGAGEAADVNVLYATSRYFEIADKARVVKDYRPDRFLIFVINETVHVGRLPQALPQATLVIDGRQYTSFDEDGPTNPEHHRVTTVRFSRFDSSGAPVLPQGSHKLELRLAGGWDGPGTGRTVAWTVPIVYPKSLTSGTIWTFTSLIAMSAGLLSAVLTPCLLQLVVIYLTTVTGLSAGELGRAGAVPAAASRRLLLVAFSFVTAFMALYTAAGALIGYVGKEAQILFAEWSRTVSIVAGILVIGLGIWVGIRARAPLVCRIPMARAIQSFDRRGVLGAALVAAGFSLGCSACFGGAIVATLLIYVGALGSAPVGAFVMLMFSAGVAVPFLLAALFLSRVIPVMDRVTRLAPYVGLASMAVIVAFGGVLITDNFHVLSNMIYPWLGLG